MASPEQIDWYDTPLHYDIVFDADTRREAGFLEAVRRRHGRTRGRSVLELACGSGRLVRELSARGWRSSGFDLNPAMLQFAREHLAREGLEAELWQDRMESFRVPGRRRHDLAHFLVSTYNHQSSILPFCETTSLHPIHQRMGPGPGSGFEGGRETRSMRRPH